jgi:Uma2 family endonuclease
MTFALKVLPNYTYQDYLRWEGRWEVIEGIAFDMSPMPSPSHQKVASKLNTLFQNYLDKSACNCNVYQPIDLKITENTIVNPDLLIICEEVTEQYYEKPPCLIVEIISPSSRLKDTITKFELYQDFGVKYYIIVDTEDQSIMIYHLIDGKYVLINDTSHFIFEFKGGCKISPVFDGVFD